MGYHGLRSLRKTMSLLGKNWVIRNKDENLNIIAKLLKNRGIDSPEKAEWFFNGSLEDVHGPELFVDMKRAVERIKKSISDKEKVMIFGDYDVDGITATAILYDFLQKVSADVHYTLPNRDEDGYGLQDYFIKRFKELGVGLIVTVDCGTANFDEVKQASELGIDTVITDHHSIPERLPNAVAIVNPKRSDCKYPNKEICGAAISYKLVEALAKECLPPEEVDEYLGQALGLVALGVVSDCMEMTGENRILVREGLKSLTSGSHPGVLALLNSDGISTDRITSTTIGFQIGPRLNAAGRIDKPDHAFELLLGNLEKVITLNSLNKKRQTLARQYIDEAICEVDKMSSVPNIIILKNKNWKPGLLGLIANGVMDKFNRPTIAIQEKEDELIGSMRSVNDFDITTCLRQAVPELCSALGGHTLAGGFTLKREYFDEFKKRVEEAGEKQINPDEFVGTLDIDCEVLSDEISNETCQKISHLEPFGAKNPQPLLMIKNAKLRQLRRVGKNAEHLQFPVRLGEKKVQAIAFRFGQHIDKIDPEIPHDIAFNMEINEWNGYKTLQLRVVDLKPSE
jgi:single-stranded-DNA-specific exonuclease